MISSRRTDVHQQTHNIFHFFSNSIPSYVITLPLLLSTWSRRSLIGCLHQPVLPSKIVWIGIKYTRLTMHGLLGSFMACCGAHRDATSQARRALQAPGCPQGVPPFCSR